MAKEKLITSHLIAQAKHIWLKASHITAFLSTIFLPLAITTFYKTIPKYSLLSL